MGQLYFRLIEVHDLLLFDVRKFFAKIEGLCQSLFCFAEESQSQTSSCA